MGDRSIILSLPLTVITYLGVILLVLGIISVMVPFLNALPNLIVLGVCLIIIGVVFNTIIFLHAVG